jgi:hypothetical protein
VIGQARSKRQSQIGMKCDFSPARYEIHPDGHPAKSKDFGSIPDHHNKPHVHTTNSKGVEKIFTFDPPSKIKGALKRAGSVLAVVGILNSVQTVYAAAPGDKMESAAREGAIHAAGTAGAMIGAAVGGLLGPIGGWIGSAVGGYIGGAIAEAIIADPNQRHVAGPADAQQKHVGGISLQGRARVEILRGLQFSLQSIDEFYLDGNGKLVLLSATGTSTTVSGIGGAVTADDFLIALAIAFSDMEVSFSLDPWDCSNPDGPHFQKVFYPDMLRDTQFGDTLFQTDYDMKKLGFGKCAKPTPGFRTEMDIALSRSVPSGPTSDRHRLWIVSEDMPLIVTGSGPNGCQSIKFGVCRMKCCCRRICIDPTSRSGLHDDDRDDGSSSAHEFAGEFTRNYDAIARAYPEYERLRTLAKLLQLAKWIRQQPNTGIDREAIIEALQARGLPIAGFRNTGPVSRSPDSVLVPRLSASGTRRTAECAYSVTLTGGIDLTTKLIVQKQHELQAIKKRLVSAADSAPNDQCQPFPGGVVFPLSVLAAEKQADEAAEQGEAFISEEPVLARDIALNALEISPKSRRAHMLLGRAYSELGLGRDAIREFVQSALLSRIAEEVDEARELAETEAAILATQVPRLVEVCRWAELFPICAPVDWIELEFKDVDPSTFRIFASKPSRTDTDHVVEVLAVAQISDGPDFSEIIARVAARETDMTLMTELYEELVPSVFEALEDAKVETIGIQPVRIGRIIRSRVSGEVNKQRYIHEHMFVIPDEGLATHGSALFIMASCLDCHAPWMRVWCNHIFQTVFSEV